MVALEGRARYRSDGGIIGLRLVPLVGLSLFAAFGLAWGLKLAFVTGWYWIILVPAIGGAALGGALYGLVAWSHCRNAVLAGALGFVAGMGGYLGYYHLCLVEILPPGMEWRVDLLPSFISFRMETDTQEEVGGPDREEDAKPSAVMNWFTFVWELGMIVGFATWFPWSRARRAYYAELGTWAQRDKALLPPDAEKAFWDALESGGLEDYVATTKPGSDVQTSCSLILEYAKPSEGSLLEYPVFVSLEGPPGTRPWQMLRNVRGPRLRQVQLEISEVLKLRPLYASLTQLLAVQHEELRGPVTRAVPAAQAEETTGELATIVAVPAPYQQRVRGKGYAIWVNLLGLIPGVYFFGGGCLAAGGVYLALEKGMLLGWPAAAVGVAGVVWGGYTGLYCLSVSENRWINRRLRHEIGQRPDPLVNGNDAEAQFVTLIPRESFAKVQLTMSSDLLLMKIDDRGRRVLMEGDSDRYTIPIGAVGVCEAECFYHAIDAQHQNQLWMIRLVVNTDEGQKELLMSADETRWVPMNNKGRRQAAEAVCQRINALRG